MSKSSIKNRVETLKQWLIYINAGKKTKKKYKKTNDII